MTAKRGRGRPTVGSELRRCEGWEAWEPVRDVWLLARHDIDALPPIRGRRVTLAAVTVRRPLTAVQRWFLTAAVADGEECYVVAPDALRLLPLLLAGDTTDDAAAAEFELERATALAFGVEPAPLWNAPGPSGIRSQPRPYRDTVRT